MGRISLPGTVAFAIARGGEFPLVGAVVATLCPFLLPPIRRHRSVIRNCVSLSSVVAEESSCVYFFSSLYVVVLHRSSGFIYFPLLLSVYLRLFLATRRFLSSSLPLPSVFSLPPPSLFLSITRAFLHEMRQWSRESATIGMTTFLCLHVKINCFAYTLHSAPWFKVLGKYTPSWVLCTECLRAQSIACTILPDNARSPLCCWSLDFVSSPCLLLLLLLVWTIALSDR